jgi:hypothetical protein
MCGAAHMYVGQHTLLCFGSEGCRVLIALVDIYNNVCHLRRRDSVGVIF